MSEPLDRETLKSEIIHYTCVKNCFGEAGHSAGCCTVADRDFIIGKIGDAAEFLVNLNAKFGTKFKYDEVFIEFKEGSKLFPDKTAWQKPENYPALRLDLREEVLPCRFLTDKMECGVYDIRPQTCRKYLCTHLKAVLELI